jgi:hypothetical protein
MVRLLGQDVFGTKVRRDWSEARPLLFDMN